MAKDSENPQVKEAIELMDFAQKNGAEHLKNSEALKQRIKEDGYVNEEFLDSLRNYKKLYEK